MNEIVVVTGASGGVGRAVARRFGREGATVALLARGEAGLAAAAADVTAAGGRALPMTLDAADAIAVEEAASVVERDLGPIDVWVNNAMATVFAPLGDVTPEEYRRATEVTYLGTVWGTMAALRRMRARDRGSIVQVGSALSYRAIPLQAPYCGAKFAIRGMTDSLRTELLHERSRVRVTMVQLPGLNTPQFDWGRTKLPRRPRPMAPVFQPEVAADAIHWAAHHDRRELWVGWRSVLTMVGAKFAPAVLDHVLARIGFDGQQRAEPIVDGRADNLHSPADAEDDFGVHGAFGAEAITHSRQLSLAMARPSGLLSRPLGAVLARVLG